MTITPEQYEKLGSFYLGREFDLKTKEMNETLVNYDSKDLVTHGVVLGMTGSGKTGLCLALLEEAAIDGVPVIAVDPKGDIGNFLLQFPNLSTEEFKPWVNEDDARRKGRSLDEQAAKTAETWRNGLEEWGESAERIQRLRSAVDMAIYTPGSNAGLPVSILSSLDAPGDEVMEDREMLADRIESTVSSLLALMGIEADPVQSPEHILLSNIIAHFWAKKMNLSLEVLVRAIQQPPIRKVGVVDIDSFFPESKRSDLAMKLNNLLASPGFSVWLEGEPLDIQRMYYTPEGKPRVTVFCISHLSDTERMFFVSLLMNQILGWMRRQSGTTSLRALFYMDEIYGYLPPTANPPSKKPMMILLKQARAFGLGLLLGTQNPVDLDYKALSNIGTWFLGRLQTERDKARVLDGLEGAAGSNGVSFDRPTLEKMLAALGNRVFLMNNVHEDHPVVFQVRWVMSYLAGPLSRSQIKTLMDPIRPEPKSATASADDGFAPPSAAAEFSDRNTIKPRLPEGVEEYFLRTNGTIDADHLTYVPAMLRSATVKFEDAKKGIDGRSIVTRVNEIDVKGQRVDWDKEVELPKNLDLSRLEREPTEGAAWAELPGAALKSTTYSRIEKDFIDWIYDNEAIEVQFSPLLETYSNPGESAGDFRARVSQTARELRDKAVDELKTKAQKAIDSLVTKAEKAQDKVEEQRSQANSAKISTVVRIGSGILGALLGGRKSGLGSVASSTNMSGVSRAWKESRDVAAAEEEYERYKDQIAELEEKMNEEVEKMKESYDPSALKFESAKVTPLKKNIQPTATGILWLPHEEVRGELRTSWERFES
ncbi:MAG: DUF853 family protein [Verrucomicrobiales bacterium]|nr:DUF853 family protein [Verrucomicrobiales bacterium]